MNLDAFWSEIREGCEKNQISFNEAKGWIEESIESLAENMWAYYVSISPPIYDRKLVLDIIIVTRNLIHDFTYITPSKTEHLVFVVGSFKRLNEDVGEQKVIVFFYFSDMISSGFYISDKIENLPKIREFLARFYQMLGGK